MPNGHGARDRRPSVPAVEVDDVSPRNSFDGNHTNDVMSWLIPQPGKKFHPLTEETYETLMQWVMMGHLAWVVLPIDNV
jgi:hypothetical protein